MTREAGATIGWIRLALPIWLAMLNGVGASSAVVASEPATTATPGPPFSLPPAALREVVSRVSVDPDAQATFVLEEHHVTIGSDHRIVHRVHRIYRIDAPLTTGTLDRVSTLWDPARQESPSISARVITPNGLERRLDNSTLGDLPLQIAPNVYSDYRLHGGPLPAIAVGSVVEILIEIADREPLFAGGVAASIPLQSIYPSALTRVVVDADGSLPLRYVTVLIEDPVIESRRVADRQRLELTIDSDDLIAPEWLEASPEQPLIPQLLVSTGASWADVAARYASITEPVIMESEVRALLPATLPDDDDERVRLALELLHERVRYTGVAFGSAKLFPNPPSSTLERGYGDCKDKAVVLVSLLRALGMPAQLALTTLGPGPDVPSELPGLGLFNHLIVHVPGAPARWIDPTAEYYGANELPYALASRHALPIVSGSRLISTPVAQADDHGTTEHRTYRLADFGPTEVEGRFEMLGDYAAGMRMRLDAAAHGQRDALEMAFNAPLGVEQLSTLDVEFDARRTSGGRGAIVRASASESSVAKTAMFEATVPVDVGVLLSEVPAGLRAATVSATSGGQPRTADWVFRPYRAHWNLEIVPPAGFRLSRLPENRDISLGPAKLRAVYERLPGERVSEKLTFDTGSGRYSAADAEAFREAFASIANEPAPSVEFTYAAHALVEADKVPAARELHAKEIASAPGAALPRLRAAHDLIGLGQIEEAQNLAREAVALQPEYALAHEVLGMTLTFDRYGRRYHPGFDQRGAVSAYRAALERDASQRVRSRYAYVLEFDADGVRYSPAARLRDAVDQYGLMMDASPDEDTIERLIWCLWYAEAFAEVRAAAADLQDDDFREGLLLASDVASQGVAAAAISLTRDLTRSNRDDRVVTAVDMLLRVRRYDEARELLKATGVGRDAFTTFRMEALPNLERIDAMEPPDDSPAGVVERLRRSVATGNSALPEFENWIAESSTQSAGYPSLVHHLKMMSESLHRIAPESDTATLSEMADLIYSTLSYTIEGSDVLGYRAQVWFFDRPLGSAYIVREGSKYRLRSLTPAGGLLAAEIMTRLEADDIAGARQWLDWLREDVYTPETRDPLDYPALLRIWPPPAGADPKTSIRNAAYAVATRLDWIDASGLAVDEVESAREAVQTSDERLALDLTLLELTRQEPERRLPIAERLSTAYPQSNTAFRELVIAYADAGRAAEIEVALDARRETRGDDAEVAWAQSVLAQIRGEPIASQGKSRKAIRSGANAAELQDYAWQSLLAGIADENAIDAAERAVASARRDGTQAGLTLASLYAEAGQVFDAQRTFVHTIEQMSPSQIEYSDFVWLARGLIAEAADSTASAIRYYRQIDSRGWSEPELCAFAARRLSAIESRESAAAAVSRW